MYPAANYQSTIVQVNNYLNDLATFVSFPTISSDSSNKKAMHDCANWLAKHLRRIGMQKVRVFTTKGHPLVFAEYIKHPSYKTILFYGHYDVQPVDPVDKWKTPPYKLAVKEDYMYGRGCSDDKGQLFIHIKAVERLLKQNKGVPVNVKFLIEGEEEIGSTNLEAFMGKQRDLLKADVAVISDTKMKDIDTPAITYALRGSFNMEVKLTGLKKDLHSGTFGGTIYNPIQALSWMVSSIYSARGKIQIPGFYDQVQQLSAHTRSTLRMDGPTGQSVLSDAGAIEDWGEAGFSPYERTTIRPSLSFTTVTGGYQGEGFKNSIPSYALVKMNIRLVPYQNAAVIALLIKEYLRSICTNNYLIDIKESSYTYPVLVSTNNAYIQAARHAYEKVFPKETAFLRSGGTIPAVAMFDRILKIPLVLMGFAQATDNMHGPNENFYIPNFFRGMRTIIQFMYNVSKLPVANKNKQYADH